MRGRTLRASSEYPASSARATPCHYGQPWTFDEKQLSDEARGRLNRWRARWAAKAAGGPVLSLVDLGSLIKRTQDALETAGPTDAALLGVQLEDMKHEYDWRTFLNVDKTIWPAE